jgi:hypothetical protein
MIKVAAAEAPDEFNAFPRQGWNRVIREFVRCIEGRGETRRPFIASIQTSQLGVRGGEGRWTRLVRTVLRGCVIREPDHGM